MAEFAEIEAADGIRMSWNVWPSSRVEMARCVVPPAAVISPLQPLAQPEAVLQYPPLRCRTCRAILNPFCSVDFAGKIWVCPFDFSRNQFPPHYSELSESYLPGELYQQFTTIEYAPPGDRGLPPLFLFVLDTCLVEEELTFLRTSLIQAIALVPPNAMVGLITFGTHVHVHELGFSACAKSYVFKGSKEVTKEQILDQLGLVSFHHKSAGVIAGPKDGLSASSINRFLLPASDCEFTLSALLEELQKDAFSVASDKRASRCTGTALNVAAGLLNACVPGTGARIMAFVGGPCTEGPGMIVGSELSEPIRSHKDIAKDAVPYFHKAIKFYEGLASQLVNQGHVLDVFACSLDQVGLAEMKVAIERSGGLVVLAESFGHMVFKESLKRLFEEGASSLGLSFNGIFEISCSKEVKVQGIIGPCSSMERKGPSVADTVIGQGNTTAWRMSGLDKNTALTVFFDVASPTTQEASKSFYLQFVTSYQHSDGQTRYRVTTVTRAMVDGAINTESLQEGFDQEAAAVIVAKLACHRMEAEDEFNPSRWLDRLLIRLCSRFGDYRKDDASSFRLSSKLSLFPQFMFNLRRSQFVQVFNNSPDETAHFRILLDRETVTNSLLMIQPSLVSYSMSAPPSPALLDVAAIAADRILLLDAYFSVVIFHGMTIAQWRNLGYQNQPEYKDFADLLQAPHTDAEAISKERFPVPRLVVCDQHGSQARFLLARLNPSATYNSAPAGAELIFTDDVSLQVFLEHLQRLAVVAQN
ncbi:hypothetical protein SELMODRAFT_155031 [Selaginella moellendorffii]|uniref:Protein transport protein SEC23 n=1 Tax=Selaginella moellendorffii TaxID=88036 RepID=D8SG05_SELML|nr:protein transport protein SEC23 [Selaginella moellendorffii]EFJ16499.1 hypothetical protein SELMODRAFT_155031 [Selaginella moellendorffii]|eukprot:XP_002982254.1 protein transport protein SEC23 [Selaginella moellendorffii]